MAGETPHLNSLMAELDEEERIFVQKLLEDEHMLYKVCSSAQFHSSKRKNSDDYQPEYQLASQIFEYVACLYLRESYQCLSPIETFTLFRKIFVLDRAPTIPDGLSWNGDGVLWFNEYKVNHKKFKDDIKADKYRRLFSKLSYGKAPRILRAAVNEHGNRGHIHDFALRLVIPKNDSAAYDFSAKLGKPFEIRNCPVIIATIDRLAKAAISDYTQYFGLGSYR